jgi:hypothetical protein
MRGDTLELLSTCPALHGSNHLGFDQERTGELSFTRNFWVKFDDRRMRYCFGLRGTFLGPKKDGWPALRHDAGNDFAKRSQKVGFVFCKPPNKIDRMLWLAVNLNNSCNA